MHVVSVARSLRMPFGKFLQWGEGSALHTKAEFLAEGTAMANRTKRMATRKIKSKGGKARNKSLRKNAPKRAAPKKAKKVATKRLATKARRGGVTTRTRARKQKQNLKPAAVETTVIDVIEEPVPGVVTITEFEDVRIRVPDSDEETEDLGLQLAFDSDLLRDAVLSNLQND